MSKYLAILIFVAAAACPSCIENEPLPLIVVGNIEGTVTDFKTQQAMSGVKVELVANANTTFAKQSVTTAEDGKFTFAELEAGSYKLSFSKRSYVDNSRDVTVLAEQTVSCDITLSSDPDFTVERGALTAYHGKGGNVVIPDNLGITVIGNNVFYQNAQITSVVIPEGVTGIGEHVFWNCENLSSVTLPNSLTRIGKYAFFSCDKLSGTLAIPEQVVSIGYAAFASCRGITSVSIGKNLVSMGADGSVLSATATSSTFESCAALSAIVVDNGNSSFATQDGVLFNKAKTELLLCPAGKKGAGYSIPGSVVRIEEAAFRYSSLTSVTIPASVTSIGMYAFASSKLLSVTIPTGVTNIGENAFYFCDLLASATIPASVLSIGKGAFLYCKSLIYVSVAWASPLTLSVGNEYFKDVPLSGATLYVPIGTKAAYEAAAVWKDFKNVVEQADGGGISSEFTLRGVTWASLNVDEPRTFAARPDMYTKFYQWNGGYGHPATGNPDVWRVTSISDEAWTGTSCPEGWRMPTKEEYESLCREGHTWAAASSARGNAVAGHFFGVNHATCTMSSMAGCLFFPACGHRDEEEGRLVMQGEQTYYWSSTSYTSTSGYFFNASAYAGTSVHSKAKALNIRCVR